MQGWASYQVSTVVLDYVSHEFFPHDLIENEAGDNKENVPQ